MKIKAESTVVIDLRLNEYEARWLADYVQNPKDDNFDNECEQDAGMREKLFKGIIGALDEARDI